MTYDIIYALMLFALATSVTPGPNNLMLLASGANFGLLRTIPHMLGVTLGFGLMLLIIGAGLGQIFFTYPLAQTIMKIFAVIFMIFLAWKIATAEPKFDTPDATRKPINFFQAVAFQWVNPKAWAMGLTAASTFLPASPKVLDAATMAFFFTLSNLPAILMWVLAGVQIRHVLKNPTHLRIFNVTMAVLLLATLILILR